MIDPTVLPVSSSATALRPLAVRDAAAYVEGTEDELVRTHAHLPEPTYTIESVTNLAETVVPEGLERNDLAVLSIVETETDDFLGSLVIFDVTDDSAEVGFWLHPKARGTGRSVAALELAAQFGRSAGLTTLTARTATDNPASQKTLERAQFELVETARGVAPSGKEVDLVHYRRSL